MQCVVDCWDATFRLLTPVKQTAFLGFVHHYLAEASLRRPFRSLTTFQRKAAYKAEKSKLPVSNHVWFFLTECLLMYNKRIVRGLWNNRISHINTGSTKVKVNSIKKLKVREQRQSLYKLYWKPEFPHLKNHHEINYTDFFSRKSQCENGYKEK